MKRYDSYIEEWARRQIVREDARREFRIREWKREAEREKKFRQRHPWLAQIIYGRGR